MKMTAMPQMVALFNGVGGGAAALVAVVGVPLRLAPIEPVDARPPSSPLSPSCSRRSIGSVSFAGSIIAFLKLQELIGGRPITYSGQQIVNAALIRLKISRSSPAAIYAAIQDSQAGGSPPQSPILALLLGVPLVLPIGGADMPVVISLLNSFAGLAAAATGFVLHNNVLIISGALDGASGTLLTLLMAGR